MNQHAWLVMQNEDVVGVMVTPDTREDAERFALSLRTSWEEVSGGVGDSTPRFWVQEVEVLRS